MNELDRYMTKFNLSLGGFRDQLAKIGFSISKEYIWFLRKGQRPIPPKYAHFFEKASNGEIDKVKLVFSPENIKEWEKELNQVGNSCDKAQAA